MTRSPNNLTPAELKDTAREIQEKAQEVEDLQQKLEKAKNDLEKAKDVQEAKDKVKENAHRIDKAQERVQSLKKRLEKAESRLEKLRSKGQTQLSIADNEIRDLDRNQGILGDLDIDSTPDAQSEIDRARHNQDRHEQEWRSARQELNNVLEKQDSAPNASDLGAPSTPDSSLGTGTQGEKTAGTSDYQWTGTQQESIWRSLDKDDSERTHKHVEDFHAPNKPEYHPGQFETLKTFEDDSEIGWADESTSIGNMHVKDEDQTKATVEFVPNWEEETIDPVMVMEFDGEDEGHVVVQEHGVATFEGEHEENPIDPVRPGPTGPDYRERFEIYDEVVDEVYDDSFQPSELRKDITAQGNQAHEIDLDAIYDEAVDEVYDDSFDSGELTGDVPDSDLMQESGPANSISHPDYLPSNAVPTYEESIGYGEDVEAGVLFNEVQSAPDYNPASDLDHDPIMDGDLLQDSVDMWAENLSLGSPHGDYSIGDTGSEMSNMDLGVDSSGLPGSPSYDGYEPMYDAGDMGWSDFGSDFGPGDGYGFGGSDPGGGGPGYGSGPGGGDPGLPGGPF